MKNTYLNDLFNLDNKVAVITGGAGVIAAKLAEGFVRCGAKVVLLGRQIENTQEAAQSLRQFGGDVIAIKANVLNKDELESANDQIIKLYGHIDILINAAGGNMPKATILPDQTIFDLDMDSFKQVVDLNLHGTVLPTLVFAKSMAEKKKGVILNIASMTSFQAITRVVGYSAAKAAVVNFTQWSATEMAHKFGDGIRVNAIAPGFFIGNQNRNLLLNPDGSYTTRGQQVISKTPMGRFGQAEELIGAVLYLTSDASKFVTGTTLAIDGGFNIYSGV